MTAIGDVLTDSRAGRSSEDAITVFTAPGIALQDLYIGRGRVHGRAVLRVAEAWACVSDIDFMRGIITPAVQYPAQPLKTEISRTPIPIPRTLVVELWAHVAQWRAATLLTGEDGGQLGPWALERAVRDARGRVTGLPAGFRFHDLRHYFASLLIASART